MTVRCDICGREESFRTARKQGWMRIVAIPLHHTESAEGIGAHLTCSRECREVTVGVAQADAGMTSPFIVGGGK